jgi:hypothetical protein
MMQKSVLINRQLFVLNKIRCSSLLIFSGSELIYNHRSNYLSKAQRVKHVKGVPGEMILCLYRFFFT